MGKEFCSKNTRKVPFLRGILPHYFSCFSSKISKGEFMPIISEEMGITSEEIPFSSEEIIIIGKEYLQTSEEIPIIGEEIGINGETIPGMKKPSEMPGCWSKCRRK
jgi:hypothetical protein